MRYWVSIVTILILGVNLTITSCQRNSTPCFPKKDTVYLSTYYRSVLPYHLYEILHFKHSSGELRNYQVLIVDSGFDYTSEDPYYDCPGIHYTQHIAYKLRKFNATSNKLDINIILSYPWGPPDSWINVNYLGLDFRMGIDFIPPPPSNQYKNDSINIQGYYYKNFVVLNKSIQSNIFEATLYNRQYGILQIITQNESLDRIP